MFFKDSKNDEVLIKVAALLIHAAKIDENYSKKEKEIIKKTLLKIDATNEKIEEIMSHANDINENSNQILDFTRQVKKMNNKYKIKIIEALWRIIYSDNDADIYETSLMRRLAGLLYIDNKIMGNIKNKIKNENL
jgi:uncharacterized tellurite resistance protein B-like protein